MAITRSCKVLPSFEILQVPELTALAASVYSTMLFPENDQGLDRIACAQTICLDWRARFAKGEIEEALPVVRRELFAVFEFAKRIPFQKLMSLKQEGTSAGEILTYVLLLDLDGRTAASVRKAVALMEKLETVGKRTLMSRWEKFKGVSHLWAAYSGSCSAFQKVGPDWSVAAWMNFMKDPRPVLATAEHYREWGAHHAPKGSRGVPTLEVESTWRTPPQIGPLPEAAFFNPQLLYMGLKPEARELLDRYRRK